MTNIDEKIAELKAAIEEIETSMEESKAKITAILERIKNDIAEIVL